MKKDGNGCQHFGPNKSMKGHAVSEWEVSDCFALSVMQLNTRSTTVGHCSVTETNVKRIGIIINTNRSCVNPIKKCVQPLEISFNQ